MNLTIEQAEKILRHHGLWADCAGLHFTKRRELAEVLQLLEDRAKAAEALALELSVRYEEISVQLEQAQAQREEHRRSAAYFQQRFEDTDTMRVGAVERADAAEARARVLEGVRDKANAQWRLEHAERDRAWNRQKVAQDELRSANARIAELAQGRNEADRLLRSAEARAGSIAAEHRAEIAQMQRYNKGVAAHNVKLKDRIAKLEKALRNVRTNGDACPICNLAVPQEGGPCGDCLSELGLTVPVCEHGVEPGEHFNCSLCSLALVAEVPPAPEVCGARDAHSPRVCDRPPHGASEPHADSTMPATTQQQRRAGPIEEKSCHYPQCLCHPEACEFKRHDFGGAE